MFYTGDVYNKDGCHLQEEINFSTSPELIAAALFMEGMLDNEAIIIHGFETFSQYTGYDKTLQFTGSCFDSAMVGPSALIDVSPLLVLWSKAASAGFN